MSNLESASRRKNRLPMEMVEAALMVVIFWGLWAGQAFFIPISLAILLAFLATPLVRTLRARKVPEWLAVTLASCALVLPVVLIGYVLFRQAQSLINDYPTIMATLQTWIGKVSESALAQKLHLSRHLTLNALVERLGNGAGESMKFVALGLRTVIEAGTEFVLILLFAIIMLASREHIYQSSEKILAQFESIEAAKLLDAMTDLIEKFLVAKLLVIAIISALSFGALQALGLKYSFLLGIITGVLTLVPEVGFVVSLVPVAFVAVATGHSILSTTAILASMMVVHLIEANIFTPKLVGKKLNLNVLSTFIGLFAGGLLWGAWGMLLSIPALGVLRIIFSTSPALQPWAYFLSEKEDRQLGLGLMNRALRARKLKELLSKARHEFRPAPRKADAH